MSVILAVAGHSAYAYTLDLSKIQTIPSYDDEMSYEQFEAKSRVVNENPPGDPALAYSIRLPDGWTVAGEGRQSEFKEEDGQLGETSARPKAQRILGRVARYLAPARIDYDSYVEVRSLKLDHDISAKNWFIDFILAQGYSLQGMRQVSDTRLEGLYNLVDRGIPYVVRTLAEMNGPRIVIVSYFLPERHWKEERAQQQHVINSFTFKRPEKIKIEKTLTYKFLDQLSFDYPISWRLNAPQIDSLDLLEVRLINTKDEVTMDGEIKLNIISTEVDTTLAEEIGYIKENLKEMGITIGELLESPADYKFHDHIFFNRVEAYKTKVKKGIKDHELWLAIMVEDRYYYIVSMLTPSRDGDFLVWARNLESFQTVIESIRP